MTTEPGFRPAIKQIAVSESGEGRVYVALCADGSVWALGTPDALIKEWRWTQLPPLPKGE
jgi:hypothetical protein